MKLTTNIFGDVFVRKVFCPNLLQLIYNIFGSLGNDLQLDEVDIQRSAPKFDVRQHIDNYFG